MFGPKKSQKYHNDCSEPRIPRVHHEQNLTTTKVAQNLECCENPHGLALVADLEVARVAQNLEYCEYQRFEKEKGAFLIAKVTQNLEYCEIPP
jgi:hypothetical protein